MELFSFGMSLSVQEELVVNHMAAKVVENVCSTVSHYAQGFITPEIGPTLWYLFTHSTVDAMRVSAVSVSTPSLFTS